MNRTSAAQLAKFTGVGAIGTCAHYAVLIILVERAGVLPTLATIVGFVVGALVNYALNRAVTFRTSVPHHVALPKFFAVATVGAALNTAVFYFGATVLGVHYLVAQVIATILVLLWNFFGNRFWTFNDAY